MLPRKTVFGNLLLVDLYNRRGDLNGGCFVECGTWRGMAFSITELLPKAYACHFFDSYEGLPPQVHSMVKRHDASSPTERSGITTILPNSKIF